MAKLFIFGIGGTGSRVIKSLAMLMASGVEIKADEIIPIIIDVDNPNEDMSRTIEILKLYESINRKISRTDYKGFFETKIENLYPLPGREYRYEVEDVQGKRFSDYIDYQTLKGANKKLCELIFSESNLDLDMLKGFKGNPNLGSVVLNQFKTNPDFLSFAQRFSNGDRIFIISSIHGGTGSAGFPLLVKNIRDAAPPLPNSAIINNCLVGAITVLPYFNLKSGEIKSEDFISKAKAALEYYIKNINPSLNSLYYIGYDSQTPNYDNHAGGEQQKNPAHFVELASALSIIDFMNQPDNMLYNKGSRFLEFGVEDFNSHIDFTKLGRVTKNTIFKQMSKFYFFRQYLNQQINKSINRQPWSNYGRKDDKLIASFLKSENGFYEDLNNFNKHYDVWLYELKGNVPSFEPFNLSAKGSDVYSRISNIAPANKSFWKNNFVLFDAYLNSSIKKTEGLSKEQKFIEIFNLATDRILNKKFS